MLLDNKSGMFTVTYKGVDYIVNDGLMDVAEDVCRFIVSTGKKWGKDVSIINVLNHEVTKEDLILNDGELEKIGIKEGDMIGIPVAAEEPVADKIAKKDVKTVKKPVVKKRGRPASK